MTRWPPWFLISSFLLEMAVLVWMLTIDAPNTVTAIVGFGCGWVACLIVVSVVGWKGDE